MNGFNHAREILQTSADTYSAADFGSRFLNQMLSKFNSQNGINSVVIPKGSGRLLIQGEGEPKPMDGYVPFYDKGIRGTLLARYEAAATSFSSLNNGNGSQVHTLT